MVATGTPFEKGNKLSRGRPPGSRNKKTLLAQELLDTHAEGLIRKAILLAIQGDVSMLRALLPYLLHRRQDHPVGTGPLAIGTAEELVQSSGAIINGVIAGKVSMHDARQLFQMFETRRRAIETAEFEADLRATEQFVQRPSGEDPSSLPPGDEPPEYTN